MFFGSKFTALASPWKPYQGRLLKRLIKLNSQLRWPLPNRKLKESKNNLNIKQMKRMKFNTSVTAV